MEKFERLLHMNYKEERRVDAYARMLHVSPKYFSKIVSEVSGKTALKWIEDYVVTEAKALLRSGGKTIAEIASELHFKDANAFSKYFKRVTGFSPTNYKGI